MACDPTSIRLKPVKYGDTWDGFTVAFSSTGTAFGSPLASVRMFFKDSSGNLGMSLTSASGITITDAAAWEFTIDEITPMALAIGSWNWSIETTDDDGKIKTRLAGTLIVSSDPTT